MVGGLALIAMVRRTRANRIRINGLIFRPVTLRYRDKPGSGPWLSPIVIERFVNKASSPAFSWGRSTLI